MANDQLERYRSAVLDDGAGAALAGALEAVTAEGLQIGEPALKTAPRGLPRDHSRIELLRYKELIAGRTLAPGPSLSTHAALEHVAATWRAAHPLTAWLDEHVGASAMPRTR
jgi:hypothetical protein